VQHTAADLADRLGAQIESLVRELLPEGKRAGNEWCVGSINGESGSSLKIHLIGDKSGVWKDFAGDDGGDALDLIAAVKSCDIGTAMREARQFLGIADEPAARKVKVYKNPERPEGLRRFEGVGPVVAWLRSHGISDAVAAEYRVYAQGDDTLVFPFFHDNNIIHIQYRGLSEKKFWASKDTKPALFGWQAIPRRARDVVICEGMKDALSWREYGFPALSVPSGGGRKQAAWIEVEYDRLARFDKIYVSMDSDDTGHEGADEIVERLGRHRCFVVKLPTGYNDVNDCLTGNKGADKAVPAEVIKACVRNARTLDPKTLVNVADFSAEIVEHFYPPSGRPRGIQMPFRALHGQFELAYGATTVLAGWSGSGKTTLAGQILLDAVHQEVEVCVASLEFRVPRYVGWLVRQALCTPTPEMPEIETAVQRLGEMVWAFSPSGRGEQGSATVERILETWEYSCARYGTRLLVLDNFSKLLFSGDNELSDQRRAITLITEFAVRSNTHVIVVAHSRKKMNEHERVSKLDIKGSGTITDLADNVLILSRNKKKEQALQDKRVMQELPPEESSRIEHQPDGWLAVEKNRLLGDEPVIPMWYDRPSNQYVELMRGAPVRYI
jgi:twinkle protein